MRKAIILSFLSVFLLAAKGEAQHFNFVNNGGVYQHWDLPNSVYNQIGYHYRGYDLVHVGNTWRNGSNLFDVTLRRGNVFVHLEMGRRGRILSRNVTRSFPFQGHECDSHCGFHNSFYTQNITTCGAPDYNVFHQPSRPQSVVFVNRNYGNNNRHYSHQSYGGKGKGKSKAIVQDNDNRYGSRSSNSNNGRTGINRTGASRSDYRSSNRSANTNEPVYRSRSRVN